MTSFFSRIKNWQLFLLLVFPYIILIYANDLENGYITIIVSIVLFFLPLLIGSVWFISIGNFLGRVSKEKDKTLYFNINIILMIGYWLFIYTYAFLQSGDLFSTTFTIVSTDENDNPLFTGPSAPIMLLLGIYIMCAIFYNMYFVGNCISNLNNKKESLKILFQIWFFPIGIWFLQPKINKIHSDIKK